MQDNSNLFTFFADSAGVKQKNTTCSQRFV